MGTERHRPPAGLSRRRMIRISAAAAGLALLPVEAAQTSERARVVTWSGVALGAPASLQVHHPSRVEAERLVRRALAEVRRLERIFSLYQPDSALVQLNRAGALAAPPPELVDLLSRSWRYAELTSGAFDPTVQPLWELLAGHFREPDADPEGPPPAALEGALRRVGYQHLIIGRDRITFARSGMAVTLNGIAQGYITDRVVEVLRAGGIERCLVDLGEVYARGNGPAGDGWRIGIADPCAPGRLLRTLALADRALATSSGAALAFDPYGRFNHIADPRTGRGARAHRSVTVVAGTATRADALSTALSLMSSEESRHLLAGLDEVQAFFS